MKSKRRQIFYVFLSLLIASMIWFYVSNSDEITVNVHDVAIEFLNEDTTLADKGLMRVSGEEDMSVDLRLKFPRRLAYSFDTSQIRLVCDLSSITYAGKQTVAYNILLPSGISSRDVSIESPTVRTVQVEIGELSKKDVEIRCNVVGNVAEGYIAGTVELLPETLQLRGQQSDIMQISYAQVTLNIENATSTVVELLDYELYDFNDQLVSNRNIHPMSDNIPVTLPVLKVKDVPLTVNFVESAGCGVSGASVRAQARNTVGAEVGQKVVVESSTKRLLGVMILVYLLPILCFFVGYFATGALASEGLRYAIAIAAFLIGIIPAVVCDRHMKSTGALTFTIVRLF